MIDESKELIGDIFEQARKRCNMDLPVQIITKLAFKSLKKANKEIKRTTSKGYDALELLNAVNQSIHQEKALRKMRREEKILRKLRMKHKRGGR